MENDEEVSGGRGVRRRIADDDDNEEVESDSKRKEVRCDVCLYIFIRRYAIHQLLTKLESAIKEFGGQLKNFNEALAQYVHELVVLKEPVPKIMEFAMTSYLAHVLFADDPCSWAKLLLAKDKGAHAKWTESFPQSLGNYNGPANKFLEKMVYYTLYVIL